VINTISTYLAIRKFWSHSWCRKVTYIIIPGTIIICFGEWSIQKFIVNRWLIHKVDQYSMTHYGVGLKVSKIVVNPLHSQISLHNISFGNSLFRADLIEIKLQWLSLLRTPHIHSIYIKGTSINLDKHHLDSVYIKKHHKERTIPKFRLDYLEINNGQVCIQEEAWGIPKGNLIFQLSGKGWDVNQIYVKLHVPNFTINKHKKTLNGNLSITTNITDKKLEIAKGYIETNNNNLRFNGNFYYDSQQLKLNMIGRLDASQLQQLLPKTLNNFVINSGIVSFNANINGKASNPSWTTVINGANLKIKDMPTYSGNIKANVSGCTSTIYLNTFSWISKNGTLNATGIWGNKHSAINLMGHNIALTPVETYTRAKFLNNTTMCFAGKLTLPPKKSNFAWTAPAIEKLKISCTGEIQKNGHNIGNLTLMADRGCIQNSTIALSLPELKCICETSGFFSKSGLSSMNGQAYIHTYANDIARMLAAWNIGKVDKSGNPTTINMEGKTELQTNFNWERSKGLILNSNLDISAPRWHMARADRITGKISIEKDVLKINDLRLYKNDGTGYGNIWLSWGKVPPGSDQIDMHYRAYNIPIEEGLRAADITNFATDGYGDGWIRLHGPFKNIVAEGQIKAQQIQALGLKIPAISTSFFLDTATGKLKLKNARVADSLEHLDTPTSAPLGPLSLYGSIDMDLNTKNWLMAMWGSVDSKILGLNQPYLQAQIETNLHSWFSTTIGSIKIPTGKIVLKNGVLTNETNTINGLEGSIDCENGEFNAQLGIAGNSVKIFRLDAKQNAIDNITGAMYINLGPESADTTKLTTNLTNGLLKDARFQLSTQGKYDQNGFHWHGYISQLNAYFNGVNLVQPYPGRLVGDMHGVDINLMLASMPSTITDQTKTPDTTNDHDVKLKNNDFKLIASISNIGIRGRLPFSLNNPSLSVTIAGTSKLANLKSILDQIVQPSQYSMLTNLYPDGLAAFDVHLGGTMKETDLNGSLSIHDGQLTIRNNPISIDNLNVVAQFNGRDIVIPKTAPLRGTIAQGELTTWGKVTWQTKDMFHYDLHTHLDKFQLRSTSNCLDVQGSLATHIKGNTHSGGLLDGNISIDKAAYHTNLSLSDLVSNSMFNSTNNMSTIATYDDLAKIGMNLDVQLLTPLKVDTNFIKMQWQPKGSLSIKGNLKQPVLKGAIELLPGGLLTNFLPAGNVTLVQGNIEFTDKIPFDPYISVKGEMAISPYLLTLKISGNTSAIQMNLSSTPTLRQDQILAALLNSTTITDDNNNPGQLNQSTMSNILSTSLMTSFALSSPQERLRQILNLDRVNLTFQTLATNPGYTITVGKDISLLGYHFPLIITQRRSDSVSKYSGKIEWRFGNLALRLGVSNSSSINKSRLVPSGDIFYSWSPK
jgi:hypothetical protein